MIPAPKTILEEAPFENPSQTVYVSLAEAKKICHGLVSKAVKRGTLKRPATCTHCGNPSPETIQGHHPDYRKPLEVIWLCKKCHRLEHVRLKKEAMIPNLVQNYHSIEERIKHLVTVGRTDDAKMLAGLFEIICDQLKRYPEIEALCKGAT